MFTEPPKNYSDAVDKLVIEVINDIVDSIVEENNLILYIVKNPTSDNSWKRTCVLIIFFQFYMVVKLLTRSKISALGNNYI